MTEASGAPASPAPIGGSDSLWDYVRQRLQAAVAGEFEVLRPIGRGGMAAVFLAHEAALNRKVAIKVMSPALLSEEGMVHRFRQEAVTVAKLSHPNVVTIHAVRQVGDLHFFVMNFVEGRSLEHLLAQTGPLPIPLVRSIVYQVVQGLAYAHRLGVVHRDVKPANLLLDTEGNAVVTDFGIAKVAEDPRFTQTGLMIGTPAYMSPEQWLGTEVTQASDQYSLGVVVHEMLTGTPPFTGPTLATVMQGHLHRPIPPIRPARPDCPPELEAAVMRMLEKDPRDRWPGLPLAITAMGAAPLPADAPLLAELARLAAPDPQLYALVHPSAPPVGQQAVPAAPPGPVPGPPPEAHAPVAFSAAPDALAGHVPGPISATGLFGEAPPAAPAPAVPTPHSGSVEADEPGAFPNLRRRSPQRGRRRRRAGILAACGVVVVGAGVGTALLGGGRPSSPVAAGTGLAAHLRATPPAAGEVQAGVAQPAPPAVATLPAPEERTPAAPPRREEAPPGPRKTPPRAGAGAAPAEPSGPALEAGAAAEAQVRGVVDRFVRALATGDAGRMRAVYPGLSGDERWWRWAEARADSSLRVQFYKIQEGFPEVEGESAVAVFDVSLVQAGAEDRPRPWMLRAVLARDGGRWRLSEIRYY